MLIKCLLFTINLIYCIDRSDEQVVCEKIEYVEFCTNALRRRSCYYPILIPGTIVGLTSYELVKQLNESCYNG